MDNLDKFLNIVQARSKSSRRRISSETEDDPPDKDRSVSVSPGPSGSGPTPENTDTDTIQVQVSGDERPKNTKRPRMSKVWKFFKKSKDKKLAKCLNCGKEYETSGNTSNLKDHLKRFHPNLDRASNANESSSNSASASLSTRSSVRSVSPFFKRETEYSEHSQRKKQLDEALSLMIATDFQPFNIVNDSGFKNFIHMLDPRYVLPSRYRIRENIMRQMYLDACKELKHILKDVKYTAITSDSWTSRSTESYLTVTCHFVTNDFKLQSAVLSTKPLVNGINHTAENISSALNDIFVQWEIEKKISCIVTDNASNMRKACELLKKKHLPCFAHTINLVVQDSVNVNPLKEILERCKEIVRYIKSSNVATELFNMEQRQNNENPYKLVQEVATRWNSAFQMVRRILQTSDPLNKTLLKVSKAPQPLSIEEITVLRDVEDVLSCFDEATTKISVTKYVTISLVIPIICGIYKTLSNKMAELRSDDGKQICSKLLDSVKTRLFLYEKRTITQMGTLLDPRFKQEGFMSNENAKSASHFLEQEMNYIIRKEVENTSTLLDEAAIPSTSSGSLFAFMEEKVQKKIRSITADVIIMKRQYMERQNTTHDSDSLLFWKVNANDLKSLQQLSHKYLCIPASSVESERTFSAAGQIVTERRARLKAKNVDMLVFINKNSWLIQNK